MRARFTVVTILFVALTALATREVHSPPPVEAAPVFEEVACADIAGDLGDTDPARLRCGFVRVPETRVASDSRTLRIAVMVLRAKSRAPEPDPIAFLTGGPGQSAVEDALIGWGHEFFSGAMQEDRDIVFHDQRGTGHSGALHCPESDRLTVDELREQLDDEELAARSEQATRTCHERYVAQGVDLGAYDSAQSVLDIEDVMTALGYEDFNLYGVSYGTRLALTAMRDSDRVRSAVLDSTVAIQVNVGTDRARTFEKTLDTLFAACAASAECNAAYPALENTYWDLISRANAHPIEIEVKDVDGAPISLTIDGDTLVDGTFLAMYNARVVPVLPFAIDDISKGNTGILTLLAQELAFQTFGIASGMFTSVQCNEEVPFYSEASLRQSNAGVRQQLVDIGIDAANSEALRSQQRQCAIWDVPPPPPIENRAVSSDVPALIFAGRFDPTTPVEYGRLVAETLTNSYVFEFPTMAHSLDFYVPECAGSMAAAFLADPASEPDASCIDALPAIQWVLPGPEPAPQPSPPPVVIDRPGPNGILAPDTGSGTPGEAGATPIGAALSLIAGAVVLLAGLRLRPAPRD